MVLIMNGQKIEGHYIRVQLMTQHRRKTQAFKLTCITFGIQGNTEFSSSQDKPATDQIVLT